MEDLACPAQLACLRFEARGGRAAARAGSEDAHWKRTQTDGASTSACCKRRPAIVRRPCCHTPPHGSQAHPRAQHLLPRARGGKVGRHGVTDTCLVGAHHARQQQVHGPHLRHVGGGRDRRMVGRAGSVRLPSSRGGEAGRLQGPLEHRASCQDARPLGRSRIPATPPRPLPARTLVQQVKSMEMERCRARLPCAKVAASRSPEDAPAASDAAAPRPAIACAGVPPPPPGSPPDSSLPSTAAASAVALSLRNRHASAASALPACLAAASAAAAPPPPPPTARCSSRNASSSRASCAMAGPTGALLRSTAARHWQQRLTSLAVRCRWRACSLHTQGARLVWESEGVRGCVAARCPCQQSLPEPSHLPSRPVTRSATHRASCPTPDPRRSPSYLDAPSFAPPDCRANRIIMAADSSVRASSSMRWKGSAGKRCCARYTSTSRLVNRKCAQAACARNGDAGAY